VTFLTIDFRDVLTAAMDKVSSSVQIDMALAA
jgi:hypothetical protein